MAWVRTTASSLHAAHTAHTAHSGELRTLAQAVAQLSAVAGEAQLGPLGTIVRTIAGSDISSFELMHSGAVATLLQYLTEPDANEPLMLATPREERIRYFLHVGLGSSLDPLTPGGASPHCPLPHTATFTAVVAKLNQCVSQLEQLPVKLHDLVPGGARGGASSVIKFLNNHQLKCQLVRGEGGVRGVKEWHGGPVKVDPLALVQAIEKYLTARGYTSLRDSEGDSSSGDEGQGGSHQPLPPNHRLEFLMEGSVLPHNITVYQAIRRYSPHCNPREEGGDDLAPLSMGAIWQHCHTIHYRMVVEPPAPKASRKNKHKAGGALASPRRRADCDVSLVGGVGVVLEALLPSPVFATRDPCVPVVTLLRALFHLNRYHHTLYPPRGGPLDPPVPAALFVNDKVTAKVNRQLQDPLVILTGEVGDWVGEVVYACPFLVPFETRLLLFYAVSFDRDRAIQRLQDLHPELVPSDDQITPRLERRKKVVSRCGDLIPQAESLLGGSVKPLLEISFEGEEGSGLGPTLEFYALVSRELGRAEWGMWRGDATQVTEGDSSVSYIDPGHGLFPLPLPRSPKNAQLTKVRSKFRFLGRLVAKAVMDSRIVDLPLHPALLTSLLGGAAELGAWHLPLLDPVFGSTFLQLLQVHLSKKRAARSGRPCGSCTLPDGSSLEDLCLSFVLPGQPAVELRKGGENTPLTAANITQYLQSVTDWMLRDGVWRQVEAFREGFSSMFPLSKLRLFYPEELCHVFGGGGEEAWQPQTLLQNMSTKHGYTASSPTILALVEVLCSLSLPHRRAFLQFATGSPRLPVGGFKSLSPRLTVVCKTVPEDASPDVYLPSVMTCVNFLKLPKI